MPSCRCLPPNATCASQARMGQTQLGQCRLLVDVFANKDETLVGLSGLARLEFFETRREIVGIVARAILEHIDGVFACGEGLETNGAILLAERHSAPVLADRQNAPH